MNLDYRIVAWTVVLALGIGITVTACTATTGDGTRPVVSVYASPT